MDNSRVKKLKVWKEFENRNLIYKENNRVLRVDEEISKLFSIQMSVNEETDHRKTNCLTFAGLKKSVDKLLDSSAN